MKFVDTNVLVYALSQPRGRTTSADALRLVRRAEDIMARIQAGEPALCSVVHLSEFVNVFQQKMGIGAAREALSALLGIERFMILPVDRHHYQLAAEIAHDVPVSINDCLAAILMDEHKADGIYSFDTDFDRLGIARATA